MVCEHKRLMSVNCVIMCADCGKVVNKPGGITKATGESDAANEGKKRKRRAKKEAGV